MQTNTLNRRTRGVSGWMRNHRSKETLTKGSEMQEQMSIAIDTPTTTLDNQHNSHTAPRPKARKLYRSNEWMSDQIAIKILNAAGLRDTNKQDRAQLLSNDLGFLETVKAAGKANQYLLGVAYGAFYWKIHVEDPEKAREFHHGFVTGANLHHKSPILALRTGLAGYHRYGNKSSMGNYDELYEMCMAAYRKWEAGVETTQIKRTDRWVR